MQKDPMGYVDGMNLYTYVRNNPLRFLDPMGTTARSSVSNSYDVVDRIESATLSGGSSTESPNSFDNVWDSAVSGSVFGAGADVPVSGKGTFTIVGNRNEKFENYIDNNSKITEKNLIKVKDNQPIQQYQPSNMGSSIAEIMVKNYYDTKELVSNISKDDIMKGISYVNTTSTVAGIASTSVGNIPAVLFFTTTAVISEGVMIWDGKQGTIKTGYNGLIDWATDNQNWKIKIGGEILKIISGVTTDTVDNEIKKELNK